MGRTMRDAGNTLRTASSCTKRDAGNVLRTIQMIRKRDADNVLRTVYTAMSVSVAPSAVSGTKGSSGPGPISVVSNTATATPDGGVGPYTYAWARISGSTLIGAFGGATFPDCAFQASLAPGEAVSAVFGCTVTDAHGAIAVGEVSVSLNHVDLS